MTKSLGYLVREISKAQIPDLLKYLQLEYSPGGLWSSEVLTSFSVKGYLRAWWSASEQAKIVQALTALYNQAPNSYLLSLLICKEGILPLTSMLEESQPKNWPWHDSCVTPPAILHCQQVLLFTFPSLGWSIHPKANGGTIALLPRVWSQQRGHETTDGA